MKNINILRIIFLLIFIFSSTIFLTYNLFIKREIKEPYTDYTNKETGRKSEYLLMKDTYNTKDNIGFNSNTLTSFETYKQREEKNIESKCMPLDLCNVFYGDKIKN